MPLAEDWQPSGGRDQTKILSIRDFNDGDGVFSESRKARPLTQLQLGILAN